MVALPRLDAKCSPGAHVTDAPHSQFRLASDSSVTQWPPRLFKTCPDLTVVLVSNVNAPIPADLLNTSSTVSLKRFQYSHSNITSIPAQLFLGRATIGSVNISHCPLLETVPAELFAGVHNISGSLSFAHCGLRSVPHGLLRELSDNSTVVDLSHNQLTWLPHDLSRYAEQSTCVPPERCAP